MRLLRAGQPGAERPAVLDAAEMARIGLAAARVLAERGAKIAVLDLKPGEEFTGLSADVGHRLPGQPAGSVGDRHDAGD